MMLTLNMFVLRDPKTRTICVSHFRDRIVHHALVNVLHPIFEPRFIHDSYASRAGKGTLPAIARFKQFTRHVTRNGMRVHNARNANDVTGYALKADIRQYFDTVDHNTLINIIRRRVKDETVLWLVRTILDNYDSGTPGKGMPLGNWTSQFFANVYLNELDQYVKHTLRARHYLRYVDDFVIVHTHKTILEGYRERIREFSQSLKLDLHTQKCSIIPLRRGVPLLGYRVFHKYSLLRRRNIRTFRHKLALLLDEYEANMIGADTVLDSLHGWRAYAMHANTYHLRQRLWHQVEGELRQRTTIRAKDF